MSASRSGQACVRRGMAALAIVLLASANGQAQSLFAGKAPRVQSRAIFEGSRVPTPPADGRRWGSSASLNAPPLKPLRPPFRPSGYRAPSSKALRAWQKFLAGSALGVAGFIGGGFAGATLEPNCRCDDPGVLGAMIGAPIGGALGALIGVRLVK